MSLLYAICIYMALEATGLQSPKEPSLQVQIPLPQVLDHHQQHCIACDRQGNVYLIKEGVPRRIPQYNCKLMMASMSKGDESSLRKYGQE